MKQGEIQNKLAGVADVIAHVLDPEHQQDGLAVDVIKHSDRATTLKAKLGKKAGFLKLFHDGSAGADAFTRERKALELLNGEQVPKLLFVAEAEKVIMTSFINGKPLLDALSPQSLGKTAEHMGQWFGRL